MDIGDCTMLAVRVLCVYVYMRVCVHARLCIPAKLLMLYHQSLQPDGELYVTTTNHILNLELCEFGLHGLVKSTQSHT